MSIVLLVGAAVATQVVAGVMALRLVRVTGARSAWFLIALGLWGMAARRILSLDRVLHLGAATTLDLRFEFLGLATSVLMVAGVMRIGTLFRGFRRARDEAQKTLAEKQELLARLQEALANLKVLKGLLPICAGCKSIRDSQGTWQPLEAYVADHSDATFTHGLCPRCRDELYPGLAPPGDAPKEPTP